MNSQITDTSIVIPLAPDLEINPFRELNVKKEIPTFIMKGKNTSRNRNLGVKKAKTPLVAFINGHTVLPDNWADEVAKFFLNYKDIDIVGGPQLNHEKDPLFAKISGYAMSSIFGTADVSTRYKPKVLNLNADERSLTSANLICKRKVFRKVKFDESIYPGEDPKFIADARKAGFKVAYSPHIISYNKRRPNFSALSRQVFNYGRVRPQKESFVETLKKPFFLVPSLFLIYLLILPTLFVINSLFILPLLLYILLSLSFSLYEGIKNKSLTAIFMLPLIFLVIHLSYGVGFIYGLLLKK